MKEQSEYPLLQFHLEPDTPIEVRELTHALGSISRQYAEYVSEHAPLGRTAEAKLLVWSVAPGSIDITFLPDWQAAAGLLASAYEPLGFVTGFASKIKDLVTLFRSDIKPSEDSGVSVKPNFPTERQNDELRQRDSGPAAL